MMGARVGIGWAPILAIGIGASLAVSAWGVESPQDSSSASAPSRLAVPAETDRVAAEKTIRELFHEDFAKHSAGDHAAGQQAA